MPVLNVVCPICTEIFRNSDDIYSTSCGHVFHHSCVADWRGRQATCPQCRSSSTIHKLYLSFDDTPDNSEEFVEMRLQLKTAKERNVELAEEMDEKEINFLHIQEQFTNAERRKKELEQKILQMTDSEANFLNLQLQYTESMDLVKYLQDQVHQLTGENERMTKLLKLKTLEMEAVISENDTGHGNFSESVLADRIRMLEQKLKIINDQLKEEITISAKLSIDNMKLQSCIDHLKQADNGKLFTPKQTNKIPELTEKVESVKKEKFTRKPSVKNSNQKDKNKISENNVLMVKCFPYRELLTPYTDVIVKLAAKMSISITLDDIVKVDIKADENPSATVDLSVEFKTKEMKNKFLCNKKFLKNDPTTSSVMLEEYMNDRMHALFVYAKEELKNNGYSYVYYANNAIFAKRYRMHNRSVRIHSKAFVDKLKAQKVCLGSEAGAAMSSVKPAASNIDDNYYQL